MSQTPFRSVQQRSSQSEGLSNLQAPDRTRQTQELARQQNIQNQNLQTVIGINQKFTSFNQQLVSENAINNQRLVQTQLSNNRELALKAKELRQQQGLADEKMLADFDDQIRTLRNAQQISANQIKEQQAAATNRAITNFGESFLKFSDTLVQQRAAVVNEENRKIQAGALLDALFSETSQETPELDATQQARVDANLTLSAAANEDEAQGRINDATELRSNNGFYAYGYAEGLALKAAGGFAPYLKQKMEQFKQTMPFGKPDAYILQQSFIRQATEEYIDKNNLAGIPPQILTKYFSRTVLAAQAETVEAFNAENSKYVKKATVERAVGDLRTAAFPYQNGAVFNEQQFAGDIAKQLIILVQADPTNAPASIKKAYDALKADAKLGGNNQPLETFLGVLNGNEYFRQFANEAFNDYPTFLKQQEDEIEEEMRKTSSENLAQLQLKIQALENETDPTIRNEKLEDIQDQGSAVGLTYQDQVKLGNAANRVTAVNTKYAREATERWLSEVPRTPEEIRQYAETNRGDIGFEVYESLLKDAERVERRLNNDPATAEKFKQIKSQIASRKPTISQAELQQDGLLRDRVNQAVSARQDELQRRYNLWVRSDSPISFDDFIKANKDLINEPIAPSEYEAGSGTLPAQQQTGQRQEDIPSNPGKKAFIYSRPNERQKARSGLLGNLNPSQDVFFEVRELADHVDKYEDGVITPLLRDLSRAAGVKPGDFLREQAKVLGLEGTVDDPLPEKFGSSKRGFRPVLDTTDFFLNKGLRGSVSDALGQIVMTASAGNATIDASKRGLFDFGDADVAQLQEFAKATGGNPNDPFTQLEYVHAKIKQFGVGSPQQKRQHAVLNASKPTDDQLRGALKLLFPGMSRSLIDRAIYNMRRN